MSTSLGFSFNANDVPPSAPIEVIPPGKYTVQIVNSEMRGTKDGTGQMLWLELDVLDGQFQGRKVWDRLNLINANAQAVEIAQRTLSAICHSTGQMQVSDSQQLHFKPMLATVKVRPAGPDKSGVVRDAQNEVRGYEPVAGAVQHQADARPAASHVGTAPAPTQTRPATATPGKMANAPWKRSAA